MSKIRNTGITDKWGFRHTCYVASAAQNLKDLHNSSLLTCSHLMAILKSRNNNTHFVMILAWLCRFKFMKMSKRCALAGSPKHLIYSTVLSPPPPILSPDPSHETKPLLLGWVFLFCIIILFKLWNIWHVLVTFIKNYHGRAKPKGSICEITRKQIRPFDIAEQNTIATLHHTLQSQKAVTAHLKSKQFLHFDFARQNSWTDISCNTDSHDLTVCPANTRQCTNDGPTLARRLPLRHDIEPTWIQCIVFESVYRAKGQSVKFWGWSGLQSASRIRIRIQIARICIKLLPEVCIWSRTNPLILAEVCCLWLTVCLGENEMSV